MPIRWAVTAALVLVVEDDATILALLEQVLRTDGYEVRRATSAPEALGLCDERLPDLALIDVGLGDGMDGLCLVRHIRQRADLPIVMVSAATEPEDIQAGFSCGADMYIEKPFVVEKLLARVAGLLGRTPKGTRKRWTVSDVTIDADGRTVTRAGQTLDLPKREFDLLCTLARHRGRVITKSQLLAEVWGYQAYDPNVVERRMSSLRRRLDAHGPPLIHTVRGCGYVIRA